MSEYKREPLRLPRRCATLCSQIVLALFLLFGVGGMFKKLLQGVICRFSLIMTVKKARLPVVLPPPVIAVADIPDIPCDDTTVPSLQERSHDGSECLGLGVEVLVSTLQPGIHLRDVKRQLVLVRPVDQGAQTLHVTFLLLPSHVDMRLPADSVNTQSLRSKIGYTRVAMSFVRGQPPVGMSCPMGSRSFFLDACGTLSPCFHRRDIELGNIYDTDLQVLLGRKISAPERHNVRSLRLKQCCKKSDNT